MKIQEEIFAKLKFSGILFLILNILFLAVLATGFVWTISQVDVLSSTLFILFIILFIVLFVVNCIFWAGFLLLEPNEAGVMVLFGKYHGTIKNNGFFWVNPFYSKQKLTLRARNLDAEPIKVNDKKGNPIMIGQVLVWRIKNTYKASFDIDTHVVKSLQSIYSSSEKMKSFEKFVKVQSDAALRYVAGIYAYDSSENEDESLTLRSGGDTINDILEEQLNERLSIAGIEVLEARVNYLAYAPEIAAVMLRRQQADAIISAREKIVDGAVGMVKMAIEKLSEQNVIELDDDKKAAMVSNLMVVLCSDEPAQPIINSGTLHN